VNESSGNVVRLKSSFFTFAGNRMRIDMITQVIIKFPSSSGGNGQLCRLILHTIHHCQIWNFVTTVATKITKLHNYRIDVFLVLKRLATVLFAVSTITNTTYYCSACNSSIIE